MLLIFNNKRLYFTRIFHFIICFCKYNEILFKKKYFVSESGSHAFLAWIIIVKGYTCGVICPFFELSLGRLFVPYRWWCIKTISIYSTKFFFSTIRKFWCLTNLYFVQGSLIVRTLYIWTASSPNYWKKVLFGYNLSSVIFDKVNIVQIQQWTYFHNKGFVQLWRMFISDLICNESFCVGFVISKTRFVFVSRDVLP